jgi:hypothetical protein
MLNIRMYYTPSLFENCFLVHLVCFAIIMGGENKANRRHSQIRWLFLPFFFKFKGMTKTLLLAALLLPLSLFSQLSEDFSDDNFTALPAWAGHTADWVVNTSGQLQSNNTTANSTFYLSTPSALAMGTEWEFYVRLAFNTSSLNYVDVFLTASDSDLSNATNRGYFVRIGGTPDEVALYRKDGPSSTKIIDGLDGVTDGSNNILKIKVTRNTAHQFHLLRDEGARGNYVSEGLATDGTYTTSAHFGILVKQSTASFFGRHCFDDIRIQPFAPDVTPPALKWARATGPTTLDLLFSEPVEVSSSTTAANYSISNNIGKAASATRNSTSMTLVQLTFNSVLSNGVAYTLFVTNIKDLAGNLLTNASTTFSYYKPEPRDVIVNEVLFNPKTGGEDYVELYNRSSKLVDLSTLHLANRNSSGAVASIKQLSDTPRYLPPGGYILITKDAALLTQAYFVRDPSAVHTIPGLPSYPNEKGTVVVVDSSGQGVDEVAYSDDWHFALLANHAGVALERLNPDGPSNDRRNWHSAASSAGYGTPGYQNSQAGRAEGEEVTVEVLPKVFSPDGDGFEDMVSIRYTAEQSGYVANLTLFDAAGRPVRYLVRNGLLGTQGAWTWDGRSERGERLPVGNYILHAELFNLQGKKQVFKKTVTLTRRLN